MSKLKVFIKSFIIHFLFFFAISMGLVLYTIGYDDTISDLKNFPEKWIFYPSCPAIVLAIISMSRKNKKWKILHK